MVAYISVVAFSLLSDSSLTRVVAFLFAMKDVGVEREDNNLVKCSNDGQGQFNRVPKMDVNLLDKSIIY